MYTLSKTVRILTGSDGLSMPFKMDGFRLAALRIPGGWLTAAITLRGRAYDPEAATQVVLTETTGHAGLAVDATASDIQMANGVALQVKGGGLAYPAKVDPIDISALISAAATISTSKFGVLWVFQNQQGTVAVDPDKATSDHTSAVQALGQYSAPTLTLPPSDGMVPIGAVLVQEGGSGAFTWGTGSITDETETYYSFHGLPEMLIPVATLALDAGAATYTYGAGAARLGTGTRIALSGKANVAIAGSNIATGAVGVWLLYALADDTEYNLQLGAAYPSLAHAQAAVANHTKNPLLPYYGVLYVVNATGSNFVPGTTKLDASGVTATFVISQPTYENLYDDAGNEFSIAVGANQLVVLGADAKESLVGPKWLQLRSGTSATPVSQTASPSIDVMLEKV